MAMTYEDRRKDLLKSIRTERFVHKLVEDLILCGVRPVAIFHVINKRMGKAEVRRYHDFVSPFPPEKRQGRNMSIGGVSFLSASAQSVLLECFSLAEKGIALGADKADSLAAAWRIVTARNNVRPFDELHGINCEEMIQLFLNYQIGEVEKGVCTSCGTTSLFYGKLNCAKCDAAVTKKRKVA